MNSFCVDSSDDAVPEHAVAHDVALLGGVDLVLALARKVEGDAGDALDLARRVDGRVDGALLAVFEGHHFLRQAEVGAAGELAQDEDVEAFDELALQRGGFGECRIADGGAEVGEEVEVLAQAQQAAFGADVVGDVVPLRAADGAEDDRVGLRGLVDGLICNGLAVLVDGGAADEGGLCGELDLALLVEDRDHPLDLRHDLGADAVAGKKEQVLVRHLNSLLVVAADTPVGRRPAATLDGLK